MKPQVDSIKPGKINSLGKAILANFLNPNPYLFWITIGGPLLIGGFNVSIWNGVIFLFTFYLMLVGSKMVIAIVGGKMNSFFRSDKYLYVIRGTGILLFILAILLLYNGFDKIQL